MNQPPVITWPTVEPGEEAVHSLDASLRIVAIANDPDSAELRCWWDVPGVSVPNEQCIAGKDFSTILTLDYDPDLNDEVVVAHFYDYDSEVEVSIAIRLIVGGEI